MTRTKWTFVTVSLGVAIAVTTAAGVGLAAIPTGANAGTIYACFNRSTGMLRVVHYAAGHRCSRYESLIRWNVRGRKGARGLQGANGHSGVPGRAGTAGPAGSTGPAGASGAQGGAGAQGAAGAAGSTGPAGPPGPRGASMGESRIPFVSYGVTYTIGSCGNPGQYEAVGCGGGDDSGYFPVTTDPSLYPSGTQFQIEITVQQNGTPACIRLRDVDAKSSVSGSEVCTTKDGYNHLRSPAFVLTGGAMTIGLEGKYDSTEPTCDFNPDPCVQPPALLMAALVATSR